MNKVLGEGIVNLGYSELDYGIIYNKGYVTNYNKEVVFYSFTNKGIKAKHDRYWVSLVGVL